MLIGTLLNALTVFIGGTLGTLLGSRFPAKIQTSIFAALGLFTFVIGIQSTLLSKNALIVLASLIIGVFVGETLDIDQRLIQFGEWLRRLLQKKEDKGKQSRFVEGFVTASLVFCVGPLTIQGAIENGLTGDFTKLAIKSMLDGFAALAFATTMGSGVLASIIVILVFQGGLAILASFGTSFFTLSMINEMSATGGVVLLAIALRLLDIKKIRAGNMLPSIFIAPTIVYLLDLIGIA